MEIQDILLPVVTTDFEETVEFYKKITGKEVSLSASHEGYTLNLIAHFVILSADDMSVLEPLSTVNAIFLVDDLNAYWTILQVASKTVITPFTAGKHRGALYRGTGRRKNHRIPPVEREIK